MKDFNFKEDLIEGIAAIAHDVGFRINFSQPFSKILLDYLVVRTKIIEVHSRKILINPDFKSLLSHHPKKREIEFIIKAAKDGRNLNRFQSKRLFQAKFHDHLLNEWKIYHFHLSLLPVKDKKFVKQVDSLLFAYIDDSQVIFLGTEKHKEGIFADTRWIKTLHDYFPDVIAPYKDDRIKEISPKLSAIERQTLWDKGLTFGGLEIDGAVYFVPGIGRTISGHSLITTKTHVVLERWLHSISTDITQHAILLCEHFGIEKEKAHFKISMETEKISLVELSTNQTLLVFPERWEIDNKSEEP